jgi:hypothetical protein
MVIKLPNNETTLKNYPDFHHYPLKQKVASDLGIGLKAKDILTRKDH